MAITYGELVLSITKRLKAVCGAQSGLEARLLICHASEHTREELLRDTRIYVAGNVEKRVEEYVARRLAGEPPAYIVGGWEFMGKAFSITRDVLIPRSDTEILCAEAIKAIPADEPARLLDLCCGSGCIGIAAALVRPALSVVLADNSSSALTVARRNARFHGLGTRAATVKVDALQPLPAMLGAFDVVVCNPPYIPTEEIESLDVSVKDYEPRKALDGGKDGLDFYRAISVNIKSSLEPNAQLFFEVGIGQALAVASILVSDGYANVDIMSDLNGVQRVVKCSNT